MVRQTPVVAGFARNRGGDGLVFVQELSMRDAPMVAAVAGHDGIPGGRVHGAFRRAQDAGLIGKPDLHLAFQFSRLDMLRMAGDLYGETALPATAKYQRIASFVILSAA